jgi:HSP20 family protein
LSSDEIEPFDWYRRFFGGRGERRGGFGGGGFFEDMFRGFGQMRQEMEREFEDTFKNIENKAPKDLVREYETPRGGKVKEYGPFVYGYSMTIGPDGRPKVREFGNVKSLGIGGGGFSTAGPQITAEREPLTDVITSDKEAKVVVELPGVNKESIKVNAYDNSVEITAGASNRKYRRVVDLPPEADGGTAKSNYKNGILEIVFNKKQESKPKGKEINIE